MHLRTNSCYKEAQKKHWKHLSEDVRQILEVFLMMHGSYIDSVNMFNYLGNILSSNDNGYLLVAVNMHKLRKK